MPAQTYRLLMTVDLGSTGDSANGFFQLGDAYRQWQKLNNGQWQPANGTAATSNPDGWGPTLLKSAADQAIFAIQVLNAPAGLQTANIQFFISFSRLSNHAGAPHIVSTPFVTGTGQPQAILGPGLTPSQDTTAATPTFFVSAPTTYSPARSPSGRPLPFELTLAVTIALPTGDTVYLGYDPELDVDVNN